MQKQTISTHHPRIVDYSYSTSTVMLLHYWYYYCLLVWGERVNGWCVEIVQRVDGTSDQARSRRGPMLISEVMSQWRWSIGVVRPNDGGSLWCTIFYSGLELSGSSRKKWLLVASKPPITKLKDFPCSIYYGGELCSFRVVIYCMLAMGPGQTLWCCSSHRREKRWVSKREVRLTQDIYPMYSHSREARKIRWASLGGKCQVRKCNPLITKLVGAPRRFI